MHTFTRVGRCEVYVVTDASGGVSPEADDMAILRLVAAGAAADHMALAWLIWVNSHSGQRQYPF
jgi:hypothetical protein